MCFRSLSSEHPHSLPLREYRLKLRIVQWMIRKNRVITTNDRTALQSPSSDPRSLTPSSSKVYPPSTLLRTSSPAEGPVSLVSPDISSRHIWHTGCRYNKRQKASDSVTSCYLNRIIMLGGLGLPDCVYNEIHKGGLR